MSGARKRPTVGHHSPAIHGDSAQTMGTVLLSILSSSYPYRLEHLNHTFNFWSPATGMSTSRRQGASRGACAGGEGTRGGVGGDGGARGAAVRWNAERHGGGCGAEWAGRGERGSGVGVCVASPPRGLGGAPRS